MDYIAALEYAQKMHEGQTRKDGVTPYINHPIEVANYLKEKGYGMEYIIAGLFHDLLEDTDAKEEDILLLSNDKVLEAVKTVTKEKEYKNEEYIPNCFKNEIAREVKMADRLHNLREAIYCDNSFKIRYINETKEYYYPLITGRDFEKEIIEALTALANSVK